MFVCLCCVTGSVCKEVHNGHSARRYILDGMFICVVRIGLCARCLLDKMFICVVQLGLCARKYILDRMLVYLCCATGSAYKEVPAGQMKATSLTSEGHGVVAASSQHFVWGGVQRFHVFGDVAL